ncbi:hypothetical protein AB0K93_29780 [Streptomyces sp. NPDC052676]|uniref:hypothetical protein n=1 Tax=Streptomyces sp. NPDC052676 TaxID=3154953 RepID=UPI00342A2096
MEGAQWPVFTVPLHDGHRLYVVYRAIPDDPGVDHILHHPDWDRAELLARDEGHGAGAPLPPCGRHSRRYRSPRSGEGFVVPLGPPQERGPGLRTARRRR